RIDVYNQARCYEESGRLEEAVIRFREYVRKLPRTSDNASEIAELEVRIKALDDRIERDRALVQERASTAQPRPEKPLYRRSWFWAAVGAVALGSATAMYLATRPQGYQAPACPDCTLSVVGVPTR